MVTKKPKELIELIQTELSDTAKASSKNLAEEKRSVHRYKIKIP
jgi:hypothetical protein